MYLLHASTFTLHSFSEPNIPGYAILSHRWDAVEVSFHDIQNNQDIQKTPAFSKVRGCCAQARLDGWEYVWIDSCCIDKSSSAELSEAINSMFLWYSEAQACYAYLSDVSEDEDANDSSVELLENTIRKSTWFTRGWTLQELLAPEFVTFFTRQWNEIGTKRSLRDPISSITGIRSEILEGSAMISSSSVAERMSWASRRLTSRTEDIAYCLLGLFGVYMSPLYGEGHNAFARLQLEIMRSTNDESIFAWISGQEDSLLKHGGLLAPSPAAFSDSGNVTRTYFDAGRPPYQMTNKGLRMELGLMSVPSTGDETHIDTRIAVLNCTRDGRATCIALYLRRRYRDEFVRVGSNSWLDWPRGSAVAEPSERQVIYVQQSDVSHRVKQILGREDCTVSASLKSSRLYCQYALSSITSNKLPAKSQGVSALETKLEAQAHTPMFMILLVHQDSSTGNHDSNFLIIVNFATKPFGVDVLTDQAVSDVQSFLALEHRELHRDLFSGVGTEYPPWSTKISRSRESDKDKFHRYLPRCHFDRISRVLASDIFVSVVFKKGHADQGGPRYLVQIELAYTKSQIPKPPKQQKPSLQEFESFSFPSEPHFSASDSRDRSQSQVKDLKRAKKRTMSLQKFKFFTKQDPHQTLQNEKLN